MAYIPPVEPNNSALPTSPRVHHYAKNVGQTIHDAGTSVYSVARTVGGMWDQDERNRQIQEQYNEQEERFKMMEAQRDAQYALELQTQYCKNRWNGQEVEDEITGERKFVPGVVGRTWQQMALDKTTSYDEAKKVIYDVKKQDFYTVLSPLAKQIFDKNFDIKQQQLIRTAWDNDERLRLQKGIDQAKQTQEFADQMAREAYPCDEITYVKTANACALNKFVALKGSLIENPSIVNAENANFEDIVWRGKPTDQEKETLRKQFLALRHDYDINRITAFAQAASVGEMCGDLSPDQAILACENMVSALKNKVAPDLRINMQEETALRKMIAQAKSKLETVKENEFRKWSYEVENQILANVKEPIKGDPYDELRYINERTKAYNDAIASPQGQFLKKYAPTRFKVFLNMVKGEERNETAFAQKINSERFLAVLEDGYLGDKELTTAQIKATAEELFAQGEIDKSTYVQAMKKATTVRSEEAKRLHELIFADKDAKFPELCKWQEKLSQFVIPDSKEGLKVKDKKLNLFQKEGWLMDDYETILYKDYVKAASYAMRYLETKNATIEQAYNEFKSLTHNTDKDLARLAYDERLKRREEILSAIKKRTSNKDFSFSNKLMLLRKKNSEN